LPPTKTQRRPAPSGGRKSAPKRRNTYRRKAPAGSRLVSSLVRHLGDQRHDVIGVGLLFFGILSGFGIYADLAGLAGHGIEIALRWTVGGAAIAVPVVLAYLGLLVLRKGSGEQAARIGIGAFMTILAASAFTHLVWASEAAGLKLEEMPKLGGVLGAGLAWPLERLLSVWGAGVFIISFGLIGLLVLTKTPVSRVIGWGKAAVLGTGNGLKSLVLIGAPAASSLLLKVRNLRPPALPPGEFKEPKPKRVRKQKIKPEPVETSIEEFESEFEDVVAEEDSFSSTYRPAPPPMSAQNYRLPPLDLLVTSYAA
jgi:hypothetical protein